MIIRTDTEGICIITATFARNAGRRKYINRSSSGGGAATITCDTTSPANINNNSDLRWHGRVLHNTQPNASEHKRQLAINTVYERGGTRVKPMCNKHNLQFHPSRRGVWKEKARKKKDIMTQQRKDMVFENYHKTVYSSSRHS
ncbi:hypothetical protein Trydic_g13666 [Trypoxylus dichotomus]